MARTKQNQRSANRGTAVPVGATGGRTPPSKWTVALLATSILSAVWAVAMLTVPGRIAYIYIFEYVQFYVGVVALISLSITVMLGVVATDRMVLSVRQRVLLQSAHRTTGVIAVGALALHLLTRLSLGRISIIDLFIPFLNPSSERVFIGLGTLAGITMSSVLWTGFIRARFAGRGKPWMWRSLHSVAYLSWPISIVHGLKAGRDAAAYVYVGYLLCVVFVLVFLGVRFSVSLNRRKDFSSTATNAMKPVGSLVPTTAAKGKKPSRRGSGDLGGRVVADRGNAPAAVLDTWVPAAPVSARPDAGPVAPVSSRPSAAPVSSRPSSAPVSSMPVSSMPVSSRPMSGPAAPVSSRPMSGPAAPVSSRPMSGPAAPVSSRPYDDEAYRTADVRSRHYVDDEPPPRSRRDRPADDRYDEERRSRSRRYAEDDEPVVPRSRRSPMEEGRYDDAPRPRTRRYAEDDEAVAARPRRDRTGEIDIRDRFVEEDRPAARPRRYADEEDRAPHERYAGDDRYSDVPRPRPPRYDEEPAPRSRVDVDRADSGRHSRADFVEPTDPWRAEQDDDGAYPPVDDTPTLIDMASRRARRSTPEPSRGASRGARRKGRGVDETSDDVYWRQLRGEAN